MLQSFPQAFSQMKLLIKGLPASKKLTLFVLISACIGGFAYLMIWSGQPNYQLLFANLTPEDAGAIIERLKEQKIPYQISSGGGSVLIPSDKVYETRMEMASDGLPQGGGVGFEIFDNTKLGMTEFVQNVNYQRALQGELSRTINGFAAVEAARVHIVMPSKSLFVEKEKPATASVALKMRPGMSLSKSQVQGIVHLVSSSVPGLSPEDVTVLDNYGKMLAGWRDRSSVGFISSAQLEFQERVERSLENRVKTMLEAVLGPNKAIVRLSCSLDFGRHEKREEKYHPDNKVIRSEQVFNSLSKGRQTAAVGVAGSNATGDEKSGNDIQGMGTTFQKEDRTVNYEIGKVTDHTVDPVGRIRRISVAVVVDGTYESVEGKEGEEGLKYVPRSSQEIRKLENIVKRAVNFEVARGDQLEVVNIPFETARGVEAGIEYTGGGFLEKAKKYGIYFKYAVSAVCLLLGFAFVVRPLVQWLTSGSFHEVEILKQLPRTVEEIEKEYQRTPESLPFRDKALQLLNGNSEDSARLMRDWISQK